MYIDTIVNLLLLFCSDYCVVDARVEGVEDYNRLRTFYTFIDYRCTMWRLPSRSCSLPWSQHLANKGPPPERISDVCILPTPRRHVLPKRRQSHQGDKLCDVSTVPLVARWPVFLARGSDADGKPHCVCALESKHYSCQASSVHLPPSDQLVNYYQ